VDEGIVYGVRIWMLPSYYASLSRLPFSRHTHEHTSRKTGFLRSSRESCQRSAPAFVSNFSFGLGRVVPGIPAFCRELLTALAHG
jgi:hypothetical protein